MTLSTFAAGGFIVLFSALLAMAEHDKKREEKEFFEKYSD